MLRFFSAPQNKCKKINVAMLRYNLVVRVRVSHHRGTVGVNCA